MKTLWFTAFTLFAGSAFADCGSARYIAQTEAQNIGSRNGRIGALNGQINQDNSILASEGPLRDVWIYNVKIHDKNTQRISQAQSAVHTALIFLQESFVANQSLQAILDKLKANTKLTADRRLSDQIRESLRKVKSRKTYEQLNQLANAVEALEISYTEWMNLEKEILTNYLEGRQKLLTGLFETLSRLEEGLASDLKQETVDRERDERTCNEKIKICADAKARIAAAQDEIAALNRDNARSQAQINAYAEENRRCDEKDQPHERVRCNRFSCP